MLGRRIVATFGGRASFDSETLWNYELGAKIGFAGGRGQFNLAVFDAEIDDLQMPVAGGHLLVAYRRSTCRRRIRRASKLELSAQPTDRFDFGISASYTESQ